MNWTITAGGAGGSSEAPDPGTYAARVVGLFDLGTHDDTFQGKTNTVRKIGLAFELLGQIKSDGSPHVLIEVFSFGEKISSKNGLRKFLEKWRGHAYAEGESIDLLRLIDAPCLLTVGQGKSKSGNAYATVEAASQPMKGQTLPAAFTRNTLFECPDRPEEIEARLPEWMPYIYGKSAAEFIRGANEYRGKVAAPVGSAPVPVAAPPVSAPVAGAPVESDSFAF